MPRGELSFPSMSSVVPFPEKVMVQTISRCNAACSFCPYPTVADTLPQGTMDEPLFRKIIDECAEHSEALQNLLLYLMKAYGIGPDSVIGHRNAPSSRTSCPGKAFVMGMPRCQAPRRGGRSWGGRAREVAATGANHGSTGTSPVVAP